MSRALIKYAGYEDPKNTRVRSMEQRAHIATRKGTAYDLFKGGMDTLDIANRFHCSEARILEWVNEVRSERRGLPKPYEVHQ